MDITPFRSTKILVPDNGDYLFFINNLEPNNDYAVDILITDPLVQRIQFNAGEVTPSSREESLEVKAVPCTDPTQWITLNNS